MWIPAFAGHDTENSRDHELFGILQSAISADSALSALSARILVQILVQLKGVSG
jgi:hypothetical protein